MLRKLKDDEYIYEHKYSGECCTDPEHDLPKYIKPIEPGKYIYTCPNCGKWETFTVKEST
jgi:hypothetical protein